MRKKETKPNKPNQKKTRLGDPSEGAECVL